MELTPANSPSYGMADIKKQNRVWRKRVKQTAIEMPLPELVILVQKTREILDRTESLTLALTERARLEILEKVLSKRE